MTEDKLLKLISLGKRRGFVTYDDLNVALPEDETTQKQIEDTMAEISSLGIDVVDYDVIRDLIKDLSEEEGEKVKELLSKGADRGFITMDEATEAIPPQWLDKFHAFRDEPKETAIMSQEEVKLAGVLSDLGIKQIDLDKQIREVPSPSSPTKVGWVLDLEEEDEDLREEVERYLNEKYFEPDGHGAYWKKENLVEKEEEGDD